MGGHFYLGERGMGRTYLKGNSFYCMGQDLKLSLLSMASVSLCKWKLPPPRAVSRHSVMVSEERKSRARARQPAPGYLWVSVGRGLWPRAVSDLNSYTYRKLEPLEAGALVIPALGWPKG